MTHCCIRASHSHWVWETCVLIPSLPLIQRVCIKAVLVFLTKLSQLQEFEQMGKPTTPTKVTFGSSS